MGEESFSDLSPVVKSLAVCDAVCVHDSMRICELS